MNKLMLRRAVLTLVVAAMLPSCATRAEDAASPAATTKPTQPEKQMAATISDDAKPLLKLVDDAYNKLKTLELAGSISSDFDASGQKQKEQKAFTASFQAPNKFRHTMTDDVTVGSTGAKQFAFLPSRNVYMQSDLPGGEPALKDMSPPVQQVLSNQNPSLALAFGKSATAELTEGSADIDKAADVKVGDKSFPALKITTAEGVLITLAVDPTTHLVRQAQIDVRTILEKRGATDVKSAFITIDYVKTTPDGELKPDAFAWAPPEGAKDMAAAGGGEESAATALEGKAAPDFKLTGLDGKVVSLAELKGSVVILDFWATWCGPCRASLPKLNALYEAQKAKGLKVFAVNLEEDQADVKTFVDKAKLTVPVLLDSKGTVGQSYGASSIPETVLIGKDGKVKKVFIGFDPNGTEAEMKKAVADAMK